MSHCTPVQNSETDRWLKASSVMESTPSASAEKSRGTLAAGRTGRGWAVCLGTSDLGNGAA